MIIWLRSQDNYDKLLHYIVEMRTDFDQPKDRWRQVLIEEHVDKDSFEADITLSPWVCVQIILINVLIYLGQLYISSYRCQFAWKKYTGCDA
jgi:hypothetical protein